MNIEDARDQLLAEHDAAVQKFRDALDHFAASIAGLIFPLGGPAAGYDMADIDAALVAWTVRRDPESLRIEAEDAVMAELVP